MATGDNISIRDLRNRLSRYLEGYFLADAKAADAMGESWMWIELFESAVRAEERGKTAEIIFRGMCIDCEHGLRLFQENGSYCHTFLENTRPCCADVYRKLLAEVDNGS